MNSERLAVTKLEPVKPVVFVDLHVLSYWRGRGVHRAYHEGLTWHRDSVSPGYEIACKPGAEHFLQQLQQRGCQLAVVSDYRWGNAWEMQRIAAVLGIKQFLGAYLSMPEVNWSLCKYADESLPEALLKAIGAVTDERTRLVGQFGPGAALTELFALGLISRRQARHCGDRFPAEGSAERKIINRLYTGVLVTDSEEHPRPPLGQQWEDALAKVDLLLK